MDKELRFRLWVDKDTTVLFYGDGYVEKVDGEVEIFGSREISRFRVYPTKVTPAYVVNDASFDVYGCKVSVSKGSPIPDDWEKAISEILEYGLERIVSIGGVDTGKSGLVTYIVNRLVSEVGKVAVIDSDTGQSDIGLPSSIGLGYVDEPISSLLDVEPYKEYFIGLTSPRRLFHRVVSGIYKLLRKALDDGFRYIILNTTGWIHGEGLRELKHRKFEVFEPDVVLVIDDTISYRYLSPFFQVVKLSKPMNIVARDMETRHAFRSWKYREYFNGRLNEYRLDLSMFRFVGGMLFTGSRIDIGNEGDKPYYVEDIGDKYVVVDGEEIDYMDKEVVKISKEDLIGLLIAFMDGEGFVKGYAVIKELDIENMSMSILTPLERDEITNVIHWGYMKLNIDTFEEEGWIEPLSI